MQNNKFNLGFWDKQTAIRNGANEILPDTTTNENISKFYKWFSEADAKNNTEQSDKWYDAYVRELLKLCKKPITKERTDAEIIDIENCKNENDLINFISAKSLIKPNNINELSLLITKSTTKNSTVKPTMLIEWATAITEKARLASKSKKMRFTLYDAYQVTTCHDKRDTVLFGVYWFLNGNPLINNDYFKYVNSYILTDVKLNTKFFKHNLNKLEHYYKKADAKKAKGNTYSPFNLKAYNMYVLYMALKLNGFYSDEYNEYFGVKTIDNREYSPLSKIPSVLRGELPFKVQEFDIKRAFPTFIDIELKTEYRHTIYETLNKQTFAFLLNANINNPKVSRENILTELSKVYGDDADKVCTLERFNTKGQAFLDFSKYEKQYIERFINENNLTNYARLHDGIFLLTSTEVLHTIFDTVEFSIKKSISPVVENDYKNFYEVETNGSIKTNPVMYARFFMQEKFKRISTADDKIFLLKDTNNVVDYFNHKTNIVSFLSDNINEYEDTIIEALSNRIAKEGGHEIQQSLLLIPSIELKYYSDTKNTFGLPFKNGFFKLVLGNKIEQMEYSVVDGFFSKHNAQNKEFTYTDKVGMFEQFLMRASTGKKELLSTDSQNIFKAFKTMVGYLCHNYKNDTSNPCIILTDMDADNENRNGRRGKSLLLRGLQEVQTCLVKGGNEFDPNYTHVFADLDKKHNLYIIDDIPAGFKFDDLYTNISGAISCQRKGVTAELIEFKDTPKFAITSNWAVRHNDNCASTVGRFIEYKFTNYYTNNLKPSDDFNCTFFQDWDAMEWNCFYSFIYRCVELYITDGILKIEYNKVQDNFKAYFNNDIVYGEFNRIINLIDTSNGFIAKDFIDIYQNICNPLRPDKLFTHKNIRTYIDVWVSYNNKQSNGLFCFEYSQRQRKWINKASNRNSVTDALRLN
jgi:hypothetical protein